MTNHAEVRVRYGEEILAGAASHADSVTAAVLAVMAVINQIDRRERMDTDAAAPAPTGTGTSKVSAREAVPA